MAQNDSLSSAPSTGPTPPAVPPVTPSVSAAAPDTASVGSEWTVEAAKDVDDVVFVTPSGAEHTVRVKDRLGTRAARLVLTEPGEWTAQPGDNSITAA